MSFASRVAERLDPAPPEPGPLARYHDDPVAFSNDLIRWPAGQSLTPYQAEALRLLVDRKRLALRGPHGLGKTTLAAIVILWFSLTRDEAGEDWKIPTTASAWAQLTHYLWPEVRKWAPRLRWDQMGRGAFDERTEMLALMLKLRYGEAFSASPSDAAKIEGAHATQLLFIYDEAKTIPATTFDATEGAFSNAGSDTTSEAYALAISTPGEPQGRFYEIHKRTPGTEDWATRHVTRVEAIAAGRMSGEWAESRARQWGRNSAVFQNRVEGEFASSDEDSTIPLAWVEGAQLRWRVRFGNHVEDWAPPSPLDVLGVDCSGSGADRTVLAPRHDVVCGPLMRPRKAVDVEAGDEEMATAGRIVGLLQANDGSKAIVDVVGLGAGVAGRAREKVDRHRVEGFVASKRTDRKDRERQFGFVDARSAAWWNLRELLDPDFDAEICLPPDDELVGDLTAPHWHLQSGGRIKVESKDDIRKRLGRSTDAGDAVVQAWWSDHGPASTTSASDAGVGRVPTQQSAVVGGRGRGGAPRLATRSGRIGR